MKFDLFYGKTPEILIADDTLDSLKLLSETLTAQGYEVRSVNNGDLAYRSIQLSRPDLILLDIKMPGLSGFELCEKLKKNPDTQAIPIIFISALNETFDKIKAFSLGGVDYITKPFYIEEVLARIQSHLALHLSTQHIQQLNTQLEQRVQQRTAELTISNQHLRESEAKFRQISEHIHEVFWLAGYDVTQRKITQVEYVSPAFADIWQLSPAALYQNYQLWLTSIHPEDRERVGTAFTTNVAAGQFDEEYRIVRPDGTTRWIHDRGFPIENKAGMIYRIAGIAEDITARKENEAQLSLLASVVEFSNDAIITKDLDGMITSWNQGAEGLFGYKATEMVGRSIRVLIPPERLQEEETILAMLRSGERVDHLTTTRLHKNGRAIEVAITISPMRDRRGQVFGASKIIRDITIQKKAERERDRVFDLSLDLLFVADYEGILLRLNPAWSTLLGYNPDELRGKSFWTLIHPEDRSLVMSHKPRLKRGKQINTMEIRCCRKDGSALWTAWNVVPFGEERLLYGAGRDISERKASEAQLIHETLHDALTGLANRVCFMQQLEMAIKKERRQGDRHCAVLFIDLDNFKHINDTLGHFVGDQLLILVAQMLQNTVREVDTVARLGGDEFLVLLEDIQQVSDVLRIISRIQESLQSSFSIDNHEIFTNASIGVVVANTDYTEAADLIRDADIAMYRAKAQGRGNYAIFDKCMYAETLRGVELENALRQAIANQELNLYFQPIVNLQKGAILEGFEVLLRWHHPKRGLIPASEFIPIAEDTGEIQAIGLWVLQQACAKFQQFSHNHPGFEELYFSVNLSGRQLQDPDLAAKIATILQQTRLSPHCLKLEVTESSLIENTKEAILLLQELQTLGIHLSLDDFGTGFSSLGYLHKFPINVLKIDKSFVQTLHNGKRERSIIQSIIALAKALDLKVTAEGIETEEHLEFLQAHHCNAGQGYYFAKPMSEVELLQYLPQYQTCNFFTSGRR